MVKRVGKTIIEFLLQVIRDWTPEEVSLPLAYRWSKADLKAELCSRNIWAVFEIADESIKLSDIV